MTKKVFWLLALMLIVSPLMFAQEATLADTNATAQQHAQWLGITAGFAMALAASLCGLAQGKAIASAVEGMARNPGASAAIQTAMLIGLAFIESLVLFTLVMVFVKVK
jgi:F-type H+-transporting ATPase subunit c